MSSSNLYSQGFGSTSSSSFPGNAVLVARAPSSTDTKGPQGAFTVGQLWVDTSDQGSWQLVGLSSSNGVVSATWGMLGGGSGGVANLISDAGTATPSGGSIDIAGGSGITTSASGSTLTISATGGGSGITSILADNSGSATPIDGVVAFSASGTGLETLGSSNNLLLTGTLLVGSGGTSTTSFTAYAPICGGLTSTGAFQSADNQISNSGYVLTSNGASALPNWQNPPSGIQVLTGDEGAAGGTVVSVTAKQSFGGNPQGTSNITATTGALILSYSSGTTTAIGENCYASGNGLQVTALGSGAVQNTIGGSNDITAIGYNALNLVTGHQNTAVGTSALSLVTSGISNTAVGYQAGMAYTGTETNNISIGSGTNGVIGESNTTRIGTTSVTSCFIGGITGATVTGTAVLCDTNGQLGTISSSRKYKKDIESLTTAEKDILHSLTPVSFRYRKDDSQIQYGLIAEEVYHIEPSLVVLDAEGNPDSIQYHKLYALFIAEIQELRKEVDHLKKQSNKCKSL